MPAKKSPAELLRNTKDKKMGGRTSPVSHFPVLLFLKFFKFFNFFICCRLAVSCLSLGCPLPVCPFTAPVPLGLEAAAFFSVSPFVRFQAALGLKIHPAYIQRIRLNYYNGPVQLQRVSDCVAGAAAASASVVHGYEHIRPVGHIPVPCQIG